MPSTKYHRLSTSRDDNLDNISLTNEEKYVSPKKKSLLVRVSGVLAAVLGLGAYTAAVLYYAQEFIHKPYCPRFAANDTVHLSSVGGIAVVHNLHCINYIYQTIHGDYYFPNITEKQQGKQKSHLAHCLHHLLSSAKCQADMTPVLLHWTVDDHVPVLKWDGVQRSCVDWESLMSWGDQHSMTHSETMPSVSSMKHPIYSHFVDDHGRFILANAEGVVDFDEFSQRADYQQWAREQGIKTGKEDAERFLDEFARKQNKP